MNRSQSIGVMGVVVLLTSLLSACGDSTQPSDLNQYIASVKSRPAEKIAPLPKLVHFSPYTYEIKSRRDPFIPPRSMAHRKGRPGGDREKHELEKYPLDSLRMGGTLIKENKVWAIILSPDGKVHQVTTGGYLGHNGGEVIKISPEQVLLQELYLDHAGVWKKKMVTLIVG